MLGLSVQKHFTKAKLNVHFGFQKTELTPKHILNKTTLAKLKPQAYLINVARGQHLVDADLLTLLDNGTLAGAALDVFQTEPLPHNHIFWRHPKITITPHCSAITLLDESVAQIVAKIRALEKGQRIDGLVSRQDGY